MLSFLAAVVAGIVILSGVDAVAVIAVLASDGLITLLYMLACAATGDLVLGLLRIRPLLSLRIGVAGGIGLGLTATIFLLLGLGGVLNRGAVLAVLAIGPIAWLIRMAIAPRRRVLADRVLASFWWLAAALPVALMLTVGTVLPAIFWPEDPHWYDVLSYHLLIPREWFELGRIVPLEHNVFSYFPLAFETHALAMMHLTGSPFTPMYSIQLLSGACVVLTMFTLAGVTRRAWVGAAFACIPWTPMLGSVAYNESFLLLLISIALALMLRHRRVRVRSLGASGLAAGLACGVKYTAVPMLALPMALMSLRASRRPLRGFTIFALLGALAASPWYVRNIAWTGNPVFPLSANTLGGGWDELKVERWNVAHSPTDKDNRLNVTWSRVLSHSGFGWLLWPTAAVACTLGWRRRMAMPLLLCGWMLAVWLLSTHLQPRFMVLALPPMLIAIGMSRWRLTAWMVLPMLATTLWIAGSPWYAKRASLEAQGLIMPIGVTDERSLQSLLPAGIAAAAGAGREVVSVGSATVYLWPIPITQLHYRSVFDADPHAADAVSAWMPPDPHRPIMVISPSDLERFRRTYRHIPPLPPGLGPPDEQGNIIVR